MNDYFSSIISSFDRSAFAFFNKKNSNDCWTALWLFSLVMFAEIVNCCVLSCVCVFFYFFFSLIVVYIVYLSGDLLLVSWVCDVLCIIHGTSIAAMLIEWAVWMCNNFIVLRMFRFEQFLQSNDTAQQQCQFTDDQCLECNQCQETEHQWQKGCSLQFEQQQQWQQEFLCLLTLSTS